MGIYGIGQYGYFQSNYRVSEIPRVDAVAPVDAVQEKQNPQDLAPYIEIEESVPDRRSRFLDPNEVSIGINKNDDFSYIGKDKDVNGLDIQRVISGMKKDTILQDYTYFVGNAKNIFQSEDGMVIPK